MSTLKRAAAPALARNAAFAKDGRTLLRDARHADAPLREHPLGEAVARALRGSGRPLDPATRRFLERRVGAAGSASGVVDALRAPARFAIARTDDPHERAADQAADRALQTPSAFAAPAFAADFSRVRVHAGPAASAAARALRARAFTLGDDVVFGEGAYRPGTQDGLWLLAHEIAHVAQRAKGLLFRKAFAAQDLPPTAADSELDDKDLPAPTDLAQPGAAAEAGPSVGQGTPPAPSPTHAQQPSTAGAAAASAPGSTALKSAPAAGAAAEKKAQPKTPGELPTGDLALIDDELAEHERWGAAAKQVGTAATKERAAFIAQSAGEGAAHGFEEGVVQGAKMAVTMKIAEKAVEKAAVAIATRLGAQAAKFTPLPGIGAVIGGVMAGIDLAKRDWSATGKTIEGFGKGADLYEQLANSIEAISTVLEVASQVANVIVGILGLITVIMWIVAVATAGVISPLAATLTTVSLAIGGGTMVLDAINSVVLKELITTFRALHAFASDADPQDVVKQGEAIKGAAGGAVGFVGGLVGAKAAEKGMHLATPKPPPKLPGHPNPPAAGGEGPVVNAEPPKAAPGAPDAAKPALGAGAAAEAPVAAKPAAAAPVEAPAAKPTEVPVEMPASAAKPPAEIAAHGGPSATPAELEVKAVPQLAAMAPETKVAPEPAAAEPEAKAGPEPAERSAEKKGGGGKQEPPVRGERPAAPGADPRDVAEFEAREAAFEAGKKLQTGKVKATRGGEELPPPTGEVLDKLTGNSKEAKELRLKYATKQGSEAGKALLANVRTRSEAASTGAKGGHFGEASRRLVPEVGFHEGKVITVGVEPGGQPKGARTADVTIAKEPLSPKQWESLKGKGGSDVFEQALDLKLGGGRIPDKPGFKKQSGGVSATELTPFTKKLKAPAQPPAAEMPAAHSSVEPAKATTPAATEPATPEPVTPTPEPVTPILEPVTPTPEPPNPVASTPAGAAAPEVAQPQTGAAEKSAAAKPPSETPQAPAKAGSAAPESAPEVSEARQAFAEEVAEKTAMIGGPPVEREVAAGIETQRPKALRPGESKLLDRSQVADPVKKSLRRRAAKAFGRQMREVLQDEGKHTPLTQETLSHLSPAQQKQVRRTGKMPKGFEFHHLMTIADYPEFGHLAESGLALPKDVHLRAGHGGDTTRPVEAATYVDHDAHDRPGFTIDKRAEKGTRERATAKGIAEGAWQTPEKRGGVDADLLKQYRYTIKELKRKPNPTPKDIAKLRQWEDAVSTMEQLIAQKKSGGPPASPASAPAAPGPKGVSGGGAAASAVPPAEATPAVATDKPAGEPASLTPLAPKVSQAATATGEPAAPPTATAAQTPAPGSAAAMTQTPAAVSGSSADRPPAMSGAATPAVAGEAPRAGDVKPSGAAPQGAASTTSKAPAPSSASAEAGKEPATPTTADEPAPSAQGAPGTPPPAAESAAQPHPPEPAAESGGPIVEHVNPAYQPPPATPDDLVSLRNQIIDTLAARAQTEQFAQMMGKQKAHHEANEKPLADMKQGTGDAITATEAHQKAIAERDEANERKKKSEGDARGKIDDYASRAGKLTSLTLPLKGLARFTGLAQSLPNEPGPVQRFKNGVLKVNSDATKFLGQLDQMDQTMQDQKTQQGERDNGIQADAGTIKQTGDQAERSSKDLHDAKDTTEDFDKNNLARKEDAANQQKGAQQTSNSLSTQAKQKEQQAVSLAAAMQFWAQGHARARADALEQTRKRLAAMGYRITEVRER
ncbi:eCIS core domain-containing protein [Paraburkholderia sp. J7]|uniref:eCIS core domain-containing protein n=1 Tax=Paraburkholderia sp. J7 TaxID=2805438 RepID=UPI002AB70B89|nr:DUF4157 domain-containing protein [Paraburkholderia sp. J7]